MSVRNLQRAIRGEITSAQYIESVKQESRALIREYLKRFRKTHR